MGDSGSANDFDEKIMTVNGGCGFRSWVLRLETRYGIDGCM